MARKVREGSYTHAGREIPVYYTAYTPDEIQAAWCDCDGQGHGQAVAGGAYCVHVPNLTLEQATELAGLFVRNVFSVPSCTYYSRRYKYLSLYYGDAGRLGLRRGVETLVEDWKAGRAQPNYGPLWLTEEELKDPSTRWTQPFETCADIQSYVKEWTRGVFHQANQETIGQRIVQEAQTELLPVARLFENWSGIAGDPLGATKAERREEVCKELADIAILVMDAFSLLGESMESWVRTTVDKNRHRALVP